LLINLDFCLSKTNKDERILVIPTGAVKQPPEQPTIDLQRTLEIADNRGTVDNTSLAKHGVLSQLSPLI